MCRLVSIDTNFNTKIMVADIKAEYINNISQKAGLCKNISHIYFWFCFKRGMQRSFGY